MDSNTITVTQSVELAGISRQQFCRWRKDDRCPKVATHGRYKVYDRDAMIEFIIIMANREPQKPGRKPQA